MMRQRRYRAAGFTLAELVASMAITTILVGGMASAVLIASHALPNEEDLSERAAAAVETVDRIAGDLALATTFIRADPDGVGFSVPDRGHGAAGPERIHYRWSGTPGDPLTYRYNGSPDITLCEDVHDFSLEYIRNTKPIAHTPRVLLVVGNDIFPNAQDLAKQALIESFDFSVRRVAADRSEAAFSPLIADHDVMYVSNQISQNDILDKSLDLAMGIITEKHTLYDDLGIAASSTFNTRAVIWITDNTHEITSAFATGRLTICDSPQQLTYMSGQLAPGLQVLAKRPGPSPPEMAVLDAGAEQYGGGTAKGRRVKLPWGKQVGFDTNSLNTDGKTIIRRAIVWAAAPVVYSGVKITLQIGPDAEGRAETQVQMLNTPSAKGL